MGHKVITIHITIHLNETSFIALYLKTHSIPKSKFRKVLVENTSIIAHEINKLRLQIREALHIKTKKKKKTKLKLIESVLKIATIFEMPLVCFYFFF